MSAILTRQGRSAIVAAVKDFSLFMAFGPGQAAWGTSKEVVGTFDAITKTLNLGYTEIDNVLVSDPAAGDPLSFYVLNVDYTVNLGTGVVTKLDGGSIPAGNVKVSFYVKPATPSLDALGVDVFTTELGRKQIFNKQFVTPDSGGDIILPGGSYSLSPTATPFLFLSATLMEAELSTAVIKQVAVFANPTFFTPPTDTSILFTPDTISDPGKLVTLRNYVAIERNEGARETFQYVIPL